MVTYAFNLDKAIAAVAYLAQRLIDRRGEADYYRIFKLLYFAERDHLAEYGRPITGDYYCALPRGPVPQNIYDLLKSIRDLDDNQKNLDGPHKFFNVYNGFLVEPILPADMDELSESDLERLNFSFDENADLSFDDLEKKSHGPAFSKTHIARPIDFLDIAAEGGASDEMIEIIMEEAENEGIFSRALQARR